MSDAAAGVFISYRRQEASWLAAWLHDRLVAQFGEARVFLDIDWIKPGVDFMQVITEAMAEPTEAVLNGIVAAQQQAQPFRYPDGLIEVPMSPISDVTAFRTGRWPLQSFLEAIRAAVSWAIRNRAVFCFLAHPSCLVATDPHRWVHWNGPDKRHVGAVRQTVVSACASPGRRAPPCSMPRALCPCAPFEIRRRRASGVPSRSRALFREAGG